MKKSALVIVSALSLSGCIGISPQTEETPVNMVEFRDGKLVRVETAGPNTIVCQDYWKQYTLWDHAVSWPKYMSSEVATKVCRSKEEEALEI